MATAIQVKGLQKAFKTTKALTNINLDVRKGSVYGLLGPNGAGKTTTIRILATLLRPDAGSATVMGHDVVEQAHEVRQRVSLTGQYASVDDELTGHENLVLVGRLLGFGWGEARDRSAELLQAFQLEEAAKRQVRTYSGGMRRRLDIAASLVATPEVLFLDEPTSGLDPRSRNQVWDLVRRIAQQGTTVLLTTQYLEEADRLAERMAVVDHGRIIAEGTSKQLKSGIGASALHIRLKKATDRQATEALLKKKLGDGLMPSTDEMLISVSLKDTDQAPELLAALHAKSIGISEFNLANPSLDDVFFALTGKPTEKGEAA
jgi:ABC-2 type transport system ATP-binding protein